MKISVIAVAAIALSISACSTDADQGGTETGTDGVTAVPEATAPTESAETPESTETVDSTEAPESAAPELSENEQYVEVFVEALDALDIDYSAPERVEAGALSAASYDMTVNGFDAGIQIFASEEVQESWVEASNSLGGVSVAVDGAALSLNSSEGVGDSAEIAPLIAAEVGGTVHGH